MTYFLPEKGYNLITGQIEYNDLPYSKRKRTKIVDELKVNEIYHEDS